MLQLKPGTERQKGNCPPRFKEDPKADHVLPTIRGSIQGARRNPNGREALAFGEERVEGIGGGLDRMVLELGD